MTESIKVFFVEDNPDDEAFARRALNLTLESIELVIAHDGEEAVNMLFGPEQERFFSRLPSLIILDLKLPKLNGLDVLRQIRSDERTRDIPVVIFSSSTMEEDIQSSYRLGANGYVCKPVEFTRFCETLQQLSKYWLTLNRTPNSIHNNNQEKNKLLVD
jgi:two-component system, response regulator